MKRKLNLIHIVTLLLLMSIISIISISIWRFTYYLERTKDLSNRVINLQKKYEKEYLTTPNISSNAMASTSFNLKVNHTSLSVVKNPIVYGSPLENGLRTPLVMIKAQIEKSLHDAFLNFPLFSCEESELSNFDGLDKRIKFPIFIFEGYFHSLATNSKIFSRNPNPQIGRDFMKPPADILLRSFYESFRVLNAETFNQLKSALIQNATERIQMNPELDICYQIATWIDRGFLFGDLSIQIHYGMGNYMTFPQAWHRDAENSLLHLALTIKGSRVLHSRRTLSATDAEAIEILEPQEPGDIYLSSSALMNHAPQFFNTTYNERVIAIHARILYQTKDLDLFRKHRTIKSWEALVSILSDTLSKAEIKFPTLLEVQAIQSTLH